MSTIRRRPVLYHCEFSVRLTDRREGFSLLNIVRKNPTTLTVSFQGRRGRRIRARYLETATRGDNLRPDLQLRGLSSRSTSYVFRKTTGLLFSTQFAQPALVVMELAEFAHLQARGLISSNAKFAGHSLGEYAALAAFTSFMPYESIFDLVYQRALRMQSAVCRDENGETAFSMMAVDPSRIGECGYPIFALSTRSSPIDALQFMMKQICGASLR